ncbi:hypothetical protein HELRODRAFT_101815 [Helobdella robusta]|uniref:Transforming growth factor beta regulator 1 n=1 Tax=Helobdella robusta TaxID=6412 RepID=T1ED71_HELRO|nr:hypothetical protein HELRODRAFT_101815 [Helobdella robusta]ESN98340.1 hypothetical protein HELRODRAFT_101815 [Helobdella robusta]
MGDIDFKMKFKSLKRLAKEYIFTNAAIRDEIERVNEKISRTKEEKVYLLARLLQLETHLNSLQKSTAALHKKKKLKLKNNNDASCVSNEDDDDSHLLDAYKPATQKTPKSGSDQTVARRATLAPLDSSGRPIFPIELGSLTVFSIGEINPSMKYHCPECIYPVGYCSTRLYLSIDLHSITTLYTCRVTDDGLQPRFEIIIEDDGQTFVGSNPDICHKELLDAINSVRGPKTVPTVPNGAKFFGLTHPTLQNLIQCFPGARKCPNYKWVRFEVTKDQNEIFIEQDPSVNYSLLDSNSLNFC